MLIDKNKTLAYVEARLVEWADWYSRGNISGLSYPSCSIEYRIHRQGGVLIRGTGEKPSPFNKEADEIENLVKELAEQNILLANVLRCHYFNQGSLRAKARRVKVSHTQFKYYVDMAHQWVNGRLGKNKDVY